MSIFLLLYLFISEDFRCYYDHLTFIIIIFSSQLVYDGHQKIAQDLASEIGQEHLAICPSDRLMKVTSVGLKEEHGIIFT